MKKRVILLLCLSSSILFSCGVKQPDIEKTNDRVGETQVIQYKKIERDEVIDLASKIYDYCKGDLYLQPAKYSYVVTGSLKDAFYDLKSNSNTFVANEASANYSEADLYSSYEYSILNKEFDEITLFTQDYEYRYVDKEENIYCEAIKNYDSYKNYKVSVSLYGGTNEVLSSLQSGKANSNYESLVATGLNDLKNIKTILNNFSEEEIERLSEETSDFSYNISFFTLGEGSLKFDSKISYTNSYVTSSEIYKDFVNSKMSYSSALSFEFKNYNLISYHKNIVRNIFDENEFFDLYDYKNNIEIKIDDAKVKYPTINAELA